ncbi:MAG TPA: VOC family protein [Blastocatellia bacterium]|nr:VOC family protein [Blastocatellia bacterium]
MSVENNFRIDYVEFPAASVAATKRFYTRIFGWKFEDYGPDYASFQDGRLSGGFSTSDGAGKTGPVVIVYASDLIAAEASIKAAGGVIVKEASDFPGGRGFHFSDPSGNVLGVWSDAAS